MIDKSTAEKILTECQNKQKWFLKFLEKLVEIETPPHNPKSHKQVFNVLEKTLSDLGYRTMITTGSRSGGQLFARRPGHPEKGYQLWIGHIDTVWPTGTLTEMPFEISGNHVSGPGIYDMKAGVTMMILALKVMKECNLEPELSPVLFITSDEETGSRESKERIIQLAKAVNRTYVLEPSLDDDGKLKTRRKGTGHYDIIVSGKASHAGIEPEKGKSAIHELSHVIQHLFELNDPEKGISVNVGTIEGGISTNVIAASSKASVDVRVAKMKDAKAIDQKIRSLKQTISGTQLQVAGEIGRPPLVQNQRNRELWKSAKKLGELIGLDLKQGMSGGGSDGNFTSLHTATLDGLGAVGEGAHSSHEKIYFRETIERAALFTMLSLLPDVTKNQQEEKASITKEKESQLY
ncbi:MAG TPA: M20 family metallopeptidase [Balneolaceae bacterium]|nr:M20 family metallopeptidase [Balneolaceae bacterium]